MIKSTKIRAYKSKVYFKPPNRTLPPDYKGVKITAQYEKRGMVNPSVTPPLLHPPKRHAALLRFLELRHNGFLAVRGLVGANIYIFNLYRMKMNRVMLFLAFFAMYYAFPCQMVITDVNNPF